jgi:hypothetical protein
MDDALPYAARFGPTDPQPERDVSVDVRCVGGWSRAMMVICSAVVVAAAVVLAVTDRLA